MDRFGQSDPKALRIIMASVIHVRGKFLEMKNGFEPNIRFEEVSTLRVSNMHLSGKAG